MFYNLFIMSIYQCEVQLKLSCIDLSFENGHRPSFHFTSPVDRFAPTEPTRNEDHDFNQRRTNEDDHGNSGDDQRSPSCNNNNRMNNSASRPSWSPKVPIFDGTVSAQFRP